MKKIIISTLCAITLTAIALRTLQGRHPSILTDAPSPLPGPAVPSNYNTAHQNNPSKPLANTPAPLLPAAPSMHPARSCHAVEYRLPPSARTQDWDEYLERTNAFRIEHEPIAPGSICVKVNGRPVDFHLEGRNGKKEIVVGSVVGPESVIRVSYCTGPARCKEACGKPARRFRDELLDSREPGPQDADSRELHEKMQELETLVQERLPAAGRAIVRDWNITNRQAWTCRKD